MMHGRRFATTEEEKAANQGAVVMRLVRLLKPYRTTIALSMLLVVINAAIQGGGPFLIARAVDVFITNGDAGGLGLMMLAYAGLMVVAMFATRSQIFLISRVGQKLLAGLRQQVFDRLESLDLQFLESKQAGDLMSRLVNDIEALNNFFSQALTQMIGAVFALVGIIVAMLLLSWQLGLAVLIMVPVMLLVTRVTSRMAREAFRKTRTTIGDVSAELEEELGGVKVAQSMNRTDENIRRFAQRNAANRDANVSANAVTSAFGPAMDVLTTLDTALVAAMGGALAIAGIISVGTVVAFLQYVQNFFRPIQTVAQLWTTAQSAFAAAERVFDILDRQPAIEDEPGAQPIEHLRGHVVFEKVSFAYNDSDQDGSEDNGAEGSRWVLQDVSLEALPGQTIALVGPTGAGKTTLVSLVPRFYDAIQGRVLVDGQDVRSIQQRSLRAGMGLVTQEPFLFSGTILDNIRYGKLDASDEQVIAAAQAASADSFIQRLPEGYQTQVGERGKLLSQGQRQLLSIARAILADPRILIMDEATASVDTRTEAVIQKALKTLLQGRTSFVIAHRLSTVRSADQVLVIDKSRIVERGTHKELLELGGLYAELYNRQFYNQEAAVEKAPEV